MKTDRLINHLRAGFPAFWITTFEPNRVRKNIYDEIKSFQRKDGIEYKVTEWTCTKAANPLPALQDLVSAEDCTLLFMYNFHWFSEKPQIVQFIQDNLPLLAHAGKAIVAVSAKPKIPFELSKDFVVMDMPLPDESEVVQVMDHSAPESYKVPKGKAAKPILNACKSLTRTELEQVLSLSVVEKGTYDVQVINDYRAMAIKKTGFVEVIPPNYTYKDIIGYDRYKKHVAESIDKPQAKGNMLIGPGGCGKTVLQMALVGEMNLFGLKIDMGSLFSKYQGETDQNIRTVQEIIRSAAPVYALFDEFEKQFAGAGGSGDLDSGTTKRATGGWLDFFQNRPPGVYIAGTANSFEGIPSPYLRPGRWDTTPFFVDLPTDKVRKKILEHYCKKISPSLMKAPYPDMKDFTGGEVEALVNLADMREMTLQEARDFIIPQIITKGEEITELRNWAKGRCLSAEDFKPIKSNGKRRLDV